MRTNARNSDLRRLSAALLAFYALEEGVSIAQRALNCLSRLVDADIVAYTEWNPQGEIVSITSTPKPVELQEFLQTFGRVEHEHPCLQHIQRTGDPSALRLTDFLSMRELRQTALYNEFFRLHGIDRSMGMMATDRHGGRFAVGLNRRGVDFSAEDKLLLELVRPHLLRALNGPIAANSESANSDELRSGLCEVDGSGRIRFATPTALSLINRHFPGRRSYNRLPTELSALTHLDPPWSQGSLTSTVPREGFQIETAIGALEVIVRRSVDTDVLRIYFRENVSRPESPQATSALNDLTNREREVLRWVAQGKSNWEIGVILEIATSTVAKHLERVFEKLGVESRTAAVAAVRRT